MRALFSKESDLLNTTIAENITMGAPICQSDVVAACRLAKAHAFISALPRQCNSGSPGVSLSSGQRQRIAIARTLIRKPAIPILDEATVNLDPKAERGVLQEIMTEQ